jgi:hypothetical protein
MKTKPFDCVEMKRQGAAEVLRRLAGKSRAQQLEYWRRRTEDILKRQQNRKSETVRNEGK